jgi:hypothetical protein
MLSVTSKRREIAGATRSRGLRDAAHDASADAAVGRLPPKVGVCVGRGEGVLYLSPTGNVSGDPLHRTARSIGRASESLPMLRRKSCIPFPATPASAAVAV